ncbi:MAG: hypothetical protein K6A65_07525 [Succinivibrionaceae bacterium]|nr:hypothetical protein [Succinivibrionaceae bacterium]
MPNQSIDELAQRHLVLLQCQKVEDAVAASSYRVHSDFEELATAHPNSEDYLLALRDSGEAKEAMSFLAATLHRRVSVWWGYLCVVDLLRELKEKPAEAQDLSTLAAPGSNQVPLPDWATPRQLPKPDIEGAMAKIQETLGSLPKALEMVPEGPREMFQAVFDGINNALKAETGMDHDAIISLLARRAMEQQGADRIDLKNSPVYQMAEDLKQKIEKVRQETLATVMAALPRPDLRLEALQKRNAMEAVFAYIAAPSDENAHRCMDIGNAIPDKPEGLLALCAFWSFGNMTPEGEQVVKTPPQLLKRGMDALLLTCALAKGGKRKLKERLERYLAIGIETATGELNWSAHVEANTAPHRDLYVISEPEAAPAAEAEAEGTAPEAEPELTGVRWEPDEGQVNNASDVQVDTTVKTMDGERRLLHQRFRYNEPGKDAPEGQEGEEK